VAELTPLEEKLGEVWGLAQAAQAVSTKVERMVDDQGLEQTLSRMHEEARETATRCEQVAGELDGRKTAIGEKAREAKQKATEMSKIYLEGEEEGLSGMEFLVMAEAGEVGHWRILRELNNRAGNELIAALVEFALPIQERHFQQASEGSLTLARQTDPEQPAS
jgi:hypothetical protein